MGTTLTRLRILRGCAVLLLTALLPGCGRSNALAPEPSGWSFTVPATLPVGDRSYVGFAGLPVNGNKPVHVLSAEIIGASSGLKVLGVFAVSMRETDEPGMQGHYIGGADDASIRRGYPHFALHPAHDAILLPESQPLDWYLIGVVEGTRPGFFKTDGVRVEYEVDGNRGTQTYKFVMELECKGPPATPLPTPFPLPAG